MASSSKIVRSDCRLCSRPTRHEVLYSHEEESDPENYHEKDTWQIVRCLGCLTVGFRHRNDDYENVWEDHSGDVRHTVTTNVYPRVVRNHQKIKEYWLPSVIRKVYRQTLAAYSEAAYVVASIGLRATIEAVCNHLNVSGNTLEKRIDQLFKGGYVSNADKKRLHAIRFLGNDAAHEIKEPKETDLRVALAIVEHLLNSVFILEKQAKSLETIIESYDDFLKLAATCAKAGEPTQLVSLTALLGRQRRLVGNNLDSFESKLKEDILAGTVKFLALGHEEQVGGKPIQLYSIGDTSEIAPDTEEFPF
ncbi:MAG: DUF4145 domain-containing protein [Bacillota bacterium]